MGLHARKQPVAMLDLETGANCSISGSNAVGPINFPPTLETH
jgi:hypothetical protein